MELIFYIHFNGINFYINFVFLWFKSDKNVGCYGNLLTMGKVDIGKFCCLIVDIWDFFL